MLSGTGGRTECATVADLRGALSAALSLSASEEYMRKLGLVALLSAALVYAANIPPRGPRSLRHFNPDRLAALEVGMWQAYYAKQKARLFQLLVTMLHEQYHYSWATATHEGFHLARAAAIFGDATGNYDALVLPELEKAYSTAKDWLHAGFDPQTVARAELSWWVARRVRGENSTEHVGALMAHTYALLYEAPEPAMTRAALLRAQAARLRDQQAQQADWQEVGGLLTESYRDLHSALAPQSE